MYKHILFATDLTEDTEYLIEKVLTIRNFTGAALSLIHVVEPLPGYSYAYLGIEDIEGQLITEARQSIEKLAIRMNVSKEDQFVEVGPTKTKILKIADDVHADLIMCGSHGRHGLSLLLGSTANAILHGAKCDVLTVRLPEEK
ncbi:MAG: universal stress protein [Gammaproteobacteria bacterium]|nr:universal stress protein [Gammaproteobacteria bacterium]MCW5582686.1 universal stress protein [Gammaproteobacteria bacterium]